MSKNNVIIRWNESYNYKRAKAAAKYLIKHINSLKAWHDLYINTRPMGLARRPNTTACPVSCEECPLSKKLRYDVTIHDHHYLCDQQNDLLKKDLRGAAVLYLVEFVAMLESLNNEASSS